MQKYIIPLSIALFVLSFSYAQEKDSIGTQVVNIVKPYTPSLSDAFKIKDLPAKNDSIIPQKKTIEYTIFSVPVASTFIPATGKALSLARTDKETLYNSYLALELGNYTTALLDFHTIRPVEKNKSIDIALHHHSSQGGIKEVALKDAFYNSSLQLHYNDKSRYMDWKAGGGFRHQRYHWYGIYDTNAFNENTLDAIEESQNYNDAHIGTTIKLRSSFFKEGSLEIRRFWDAYGTAESRIFIKPEFAFPIAGERINTQITLDYLDGNFDRAYLDNTPVNYGSFIAGMQPSLVILRDHVKVKLGAGLVYASDPERRENDFFIYPKVTASYNMVNNEIILYGGVEGNLIQNTYRNFVSYNPFVSPTLDIRPTDKQYDAYFGIKGNIIPAVNYHFKGAYSVENNKALFQLNPVANIANGEAYTYGNSYRIIYDDVKTFSVLAELDVALYKNLDVNFQTEFFDYRLDNESQAWNLADIQASLSARYTPGVHWAGGIQLFYIGTRKDLLSGEGFADTQLVDADAYVDINANISYRFNKQLSAFLRANNMLNNNYNRWVTYPVQGFQVLAGASYQFNF